MSEPEEKFEIVTIQWPTIEKVLWSQEEYDGTRFAVDKDGVTLVYSYGIWSFNLFMLALAKELGPIVEPKLEGFEQVYETLAALTMEMSMPVLVPENGAEEFFIKLPCIRITGMPEHN